MERSFPTERDPDLPYGAGKTLWAHIYNRIRSRQGIFPVKEKAGTWEAFELALRQGADILEMDVFRTTDGKLFIPASNEPSSHACMDIWRLPRGSNTPLLAAGYLIFHDGTESYILGKNCSVKEMTAEEVRKQRLINKTGSRLEHGIETLDAVLEQFKDRCLIIWTGAGGAGRMSLRR